MYTVDHNTVRCDGKVISTFITPELAVKVADICNLHERLEKEHTDKDGWTFRNTPLSLIQTEQDMWRLHNFPNVSPEYALLGIGEELGELYHDHLKMTRGIRGVGLDDLKDSIGDMVIFLISYCNVMDIDLANVVTDTWETVKKRDWVKFPKDGMTE